MQLLANCDSFHTTRPSGEGTSEKIAVYPCGRIAEGGIKRQGGGARGRAGEGRKRYIIRRADCLRKSSLLPYGNDELTDLPRADGEARVSAQCSKGASLVVEI